MNQYEVTLTLTKRVNGRAQRSQGRYTVTAKNLEVADRMAREVARSDGWKPIYKSDIRRLT